LPFVVLVPHILGPLLDEMLRTRVDDCHSDGNDQQSANKGFHGSALEPGIGLIEVLSVRQIAEGLKMPGTQGFRNGMFLLEPLAQIHQFATVAAEWPERSGKPGTPLRAARTPDNDLGKVAGHDDIGKRRFRNPAFRR
jgi:hypothetical protein